MRLANSCYTLMLTFLAQPRRDYVAMATVVFKNKDLKTGHVRFQLCFYHVVDEPGKKKNKK